MESTIESITASIMTSRRESGLLAGTPRWPWPRPVCYTGAKSLNGVTDDTEPLTITLLSHARTNLLDRD
jgi:hypothetical protein